MLVSSLFSRASRARRCSTTDGVEHVCQHHQCQQQQRRSQQRQHLLGSSVKMMTLMTVMMTLLVVFASTAFASAASSPSASSSTTTISTELLTSNANKHDVDLLHASWSTLTSSSSLTSPAAAHAAISLAKQLNLAVPSHAVSLLSNVDPARDSPQSTYFSITGRRLAGVTVAPLSAHAKGALAAALRSMTTGSTDANDLAVYTYAAETLLLGGSEIDAASLLRQLDAFLEADSLFRRATSAPEGDFFHTSLVWNLLATALGDATLGANKELRTFAQRLFDSAEQVFSSGAAPEIQDYTFGAPAGVSRAQVVANLLRGAQRLALALQKPFQLSTHASLVKHLAVSLLSAKSSRSLLDLDAMHSGLRVIATLSNAPLTVQVSTAPNLHVQLSSVVGTPVRSANAIVVRLSGADSASAQTLALTEVSDAHGVFHAPGVWSSLAAGAYKVQVSAAGATGAPLTFSVFKTSKAPVPSASVVLSDSAKVDAKQASQALPVQYPKQWTPSSLVSDPSQYLHVKVVLPAATSPLPSQVALKLTLQRDASVAAVFDLKAVSSASSASSASASSSESTYTLVLNLGSLDFFESLKASGAYDLAILLGHAQYEAPLKWSLATIELTVPSLSEKSALLAPRPLISHSFRPSDQRASGFMSMVFTLVVAAPFAVLMFGLVITGPRLELPTSPQEVLYAFVFHASIASIIALYVIYWLSLNIFEAGVGLLVVGAVALFSGNGALNALHRRKQLSSKSKKE